MENATKALLIAAGMLFAIMVVTLLIMGWNSISNYFQSQNEQTKEVQLAEFNQQFENYANDDIRGSDLLSLANKAIDYNIRVVQEDATGYKKISINVEMGNDLISFHYSEEGKLIKNSQLTIDGLRNISSQAQEIEGIYGSAAEAGKLSANIHKFISNDIKDEEAISELNKILNNYNVDKKNLMTVKEHALTYYEITQFKRAHFECTGTTYDKDTGRIIAMKFKFTGNFE